MKRHFKNRFRILPREVLVAVAVFGVLAFLVVPALKFKRGEFDETLPNARSLQQATQMMTLDSQQTGKGLQWTSVESNGEMIAVPIATYFDALVNSGYMTKSELRKALTAPGKGPSSSAPNADNICFKIFQVEDTSPSDQPFLVTANWQDRQLTGDAPYGRKKFVVFYKGGGGGVYKRQEDAASTNVFPQAGTGPCGTLYYYVTLK